MSAVHVQALFGDRYGNAAMMRRITQSQFETFQEIHEIMKVKHAEKLHDWYEFDGNAVPACYSLKASDTITIIHWIIYCALYAKICCWWSKFYNCCSCLHV